LLFTLLPWRNTRHSQFTKLWEEYSSPEMLRALQTLYDLWDDCEGDADRIVDTFVERYGDSPPGDTRLYAARRKVSHYFQRLAVLDAKGLIPRRFRREWFGLSMDAVAILHPIETRAMRQILPVREMPEELLPESPSVDLNRMFGLYNRWRRMVRRRQRIPAETGYLARLLLLGRSSLPSWFWRKQRARKRSQ
jgi:hypothetical protein